MKASSRFSEILKRIFQAGGLVRSKVSKAAKSSKSGVLKGFAEPLKVASLKIDPVIETWAKSKSGSSSKSSTMKRLVESVAKPVTTLTKKKAKAKTPAGATKKTTKQVNPGTAAINI
jgi:hypothetical protein|tara:strand:- start:165 stop:515 length:351 start_codon:yes stop_codon:yes gene_type:complete